MAQAVKLKGPVQTFRFNAKSTVGDLLIVVNQLEKEGKPPFLKFVGYRGEIEAVEILVEEPRFELALHGRDAIEVPSDASAEMAVIDREQPDPAARQRAMDNDVRWLSVVPDTPVYFDGEWTTWGELSGNEKMECEFNGDGIIVGGMPV